MPKHKKDKHAQSISKGRRAKQPGVPPAGAQPANRGETNAFQQHDASRRAGSFAGAGNHPRTGNPGHQ
jgi:hypothetical protein